MKILIQDARILDKNSPFHKKVSNILIADGKISAIGHKRFTADRTISAKGMILSPGWFDLGTFVGDPGLEHKEDLSSATMAAQAGGFTGIAVLPNTVPSIQTKNDVTYLIKNNSNRLVQVHVLASVTRNNKGEELTEMIDLSRAGAIGFTDGLNPIWHTDIFLKSLQYLQSFNGVLIDRPVDTWLTMYGQMHEGLTSTQIGLKGLPRIAEELMVQRDINLLGYAGGRLHLSRISSGTVLPLIRNARKRLNLTCDIAAYQPLLEDTSLVDFDTNYKVNPPLREASDNKALIKGLEDGTIDIISSGHVPQEEESKNLEFDHAEFGMINLQTFGANLVILADSIGWDLVIDKVTRAPRALFGLDIPVVDEGQQADLTLFDPSATWTLDETTNLSRSANSPWFGKTITGKAVAVFNNGMYWTDSGL